MTQTPDHSISSVLAWWGCVAPFQQWHYRANKMLGVDLSFYLEPEKLSQKSRPSDDKKFGVWISFMKRTQTDLGPVLILTLCAHVTYRTLDASQNKVF